MSNFVSCVIVLGKANPLNCVYSHEITPLSSDELHDGMNVELYYR